MDELIAQADERLTNVEGYALEGLAGQLYEERSRLGLGDFALSERIQGYWDRGDVEIDLVAINKSEKRIRFGTCKRNPERLTPSITALKAGAESFLRSHDRFQSWEIEFVAISPSIPRGIRAALADSQVHAQDVRDLTAGM